MSSSSSGEIKDSSSSSQTGNIFLDNIDLFRQYSLDPDLIELYFNKGVYVEEVDLEGYGYSSSSSSFASVDLQINLKRRSFDPFEENLRFPEDLQIYVYDDTLNGFPHGSVVSAQKIENQDKIEVHLDGLSIQEGDEFSFQLNVEHPILASVRTRFTVRSEGVFYYDMYFFERLGEFDPRLDSSYVSYLLGWIGQFWQGWDAGDKSLVPELVRPIGAVNRGFDPFAHAKWKVVDTLSVQSVFAMQTYELPPLSPPMGDPPLVGYNFLGVPMSIWRCILRGGLYKRTDPTIESTDLEDWVGKPISEIFSDGPDFDCKSFTAAAINALKNQITAACPGPPSPTFSIQIVWSRRAAHALIYVDLGSPYLGCCYGKFFYDPQSIAIFKSKEDFCSHPDYKKYCEDGGPMWATIPEGQENDPSLLPDYVNTFGNPDWEKFESEIQRIEGIVCGCLNGNYLDGTAEKMLQGRCEDGSFGDWFKDAYSFEPGKQDSPMPGMPQILGCDVFRCGTPAKEGDSPCSKTIENSFSAGKTQYICETRCRERWFCEDGNCTSRYSTAELGPDEYETPKQCAESGGCCPPGTTRVEVPSNMLGTQQFVCTCAPGSCGLGYCCEKGIFHGSNGDCMPCDGCCEPDPVFGLETCQPCPDKTKTFYMFDQYPESGNRPFG